MNRNEHYLVINLILLTIIIGIFAYSFLSGTKGYSYKIPSGSLYLYGKPSISTGLTRSFSALTHFKFREAKQLNVYGVRIFLFFFIQLLIRAGAIFIYRKLDVKRRSLLMFADIIGSVVFFIIAFLPFIVNNFQHFLEKLN